MTIGLTGNIAAGKSTVSKYLAEWGADIIDADLIARQVVEPGTEGAARIAAAFGEAYFDNGVLNRRKLGALVFADEAARKQLEAITHPLIYREMQRRIAVSTAELQVVDAALLYEAGMEHLCEEVWLIVAEDALRCRRIMLRDGLGEEEAKQRIASQMPQSEKMARADRVFPSSDEGYPWMDGVNQALREVTHGR